jgi:hypothetical protein
MRYPVSYTIHESDQTEVRVLATRLPEGTTNREFLPPAHLQAYGSPQSKRSELVMDPKERHRPTTCHHVILTVAEIRSTHQQH